MNDTTQTVDVQLQWKDIDLVLVDQIVGYTAMEGVARIAIGQLSFVPNSPMPVARPVAMIGATKAALERIQSQLGDIINSMSTNDSFIVPPVQPGNE